MQIDSPHTPWQLPFTPSSKNTITSRPRTASEILAAFSPKSQPKKSPSQISSSPESYPITMNMDRRLRQKKQPVSYEISSDEEDLNSQLDSSFSTPVKAKAKRVSIVSLEDESEESEPQNTPPPRSSAAGHSLRQHGDLKLSLQARENADKPARKKRKISSRTSKAVLLKPSPKNSTPQQTARNELRNYVNTETAGKRATFFMAKKDLFLPLLPENNYIQKLLSQRGKDAVHNEVEYQVIEKQPDG